MASQLELTQKPFIELQIEALAEDNKIKPEKVEDFIDELEAKLLSIKDLDYNKILNRTFRIPLIGRPNSLNADYPRSFEFIPPERLEVVGGFQTSTALKRKSHVDLAVFMPVECLDKKDIKNQRYQHKRALYLAQIAFLLNGKLGEGLIEKLEFQYYQGDFLKPVLLISPHSAKLKNKITFQLFICLPENAIKLSLLHPDHGNIAPKWFFKDYNFEDLDSSLEEFIEGDSDVCVSPFYNSSILFDLEMVPNSNILYEQIGAHPSLKESLMLTKIWLLQRELHQFSFIISMFVAYLQTKQILHQNMSSYQIFKTTIKSIATSEWKESGFSYYDDFRDKIKMFSSYFPIVFLSPSGNLNLCYNITEDLYLRLKHEAILSQSILTDTFEMLFLKKVNFVNKFDAIVHLPKCTKKLPMNNLDFIKRFMDHSVFTPKVYSSNILNLVQKALNDRILLVQESPNHTVFNKRWNLKGIPYDPSNEDNTFTFGLLLEPEKSLRIIDVGPEAQTPESEVFRQFWEPKCQLRLQNGVISETVVWHVNRFSQRRSIIKYILTHALKRLSIQNVVVHYTLLERFISLQNIFFEWSDEQKNQITNGQAQKRKLDEFTGQPIGVGEEVFQKVLHAYNGLNKIIRNVEGLKHLITGIQSISPHLRASSVFPPLPVNLQIRNKTLKRRKGVTLFPTDFTQTGKVLHIEPIEILITVENTGKWPNDLSAFKAAKLDYLIELGEALKDKQYTVKFANNYLDVLYGQFVFRLKIKCIKELTLLASGSGKQEFQRCRFELEILPRVHAALDQLYREKPAFGLTCRLVKRWLSCHLMTDHISDIALDLIVAHTFLHPQPYTEPSSSLCGFRRFLMLMSKHDWKQLPLVVNFDNQLKIDEINTIRNSMLESRSKFPPLVLCTPYDKDSSPWTKLEPDSAKLELLCQICNKAFEYLNKDILSSLETVEECKSLFLPNFKLFNLMIKLHPHIVQNFFASIHPPKGYKLTGKEKSGDLKVMPIVGLNIIEEYVKILRKKYDDVAVFFFDRYGQRVVGVILKPEFKKLDKDEFIKDIKQLGTKLVESVKVQDQVKP